MIEFKNNISIFCLLIFFVNKRPKYSEKNMRYAHFAEIRGKFKNKRNMQKSHIHVFLTFLASDCYVLPLCYLWITRL